MGKYRSEVVKLIQSWVGKNEKDGSHKEIIDIYNAHKPLARNYKVKYTDAWCATTVSAVAIKLGYTDIIPLECGCEEMIRLFKNMGCWVENDAYVPNTADIIFYDWQDSGKGDNTGWADHVGIVEKVEGNTITVIEGNINDSVGRRTISVNGRYIRGYGVPKYDNEPVVQKPTPAPAQVHVPAPTPAKSKVNPAVLEWQKAAIADGFKFPIYGADGEWGAECESVAKQAIVKQRLTYTNRNLTKIVQRAVGVTVDGKFGKNTKAAVIAFQKAHGLVADGCVGINTWKVILGV